MNGGPISLVRSGCSIGNNDNGIGTGSCLQNAVWQQYFLRQYRETETLYLWAITLSIRLKLIERGSPLMFKIEWSHFSIWAQIGPQGAPGLRPYVNRDRVIHYITSLGPKAHRAWGPALCGTTSLGS